jgi:hypothetical protein
MKERRAIADIAVDPQRGWGLPTFGSKKPFRYWAHVHFEKDPTWGQRTWTLLVDLDKEPEVSAGRVDAVVYFMAPNAPQELLEEGAKFELVCGESHYANGTIKRIFAVEATGQSGALS